MWIYSINCKSPCCCGCFSRERELVIIKDTYAWSWCPDSGKDLCLCSLLKGLLKTSRRFTGGKCRNHRTVWCTVEPSTGKLLLSAPLHLICLLPASSKLTPQHLHPSVTCSSLCCKAQVNTKPLLLFSTHLLRERERNVCVQAGFIEE